MRALQVEQGRVGGLGSLLHYSPRNMNISMAVANQNKAQGYNLLKSALFPSSGQGLLKFARLVGLAPVALSSLISVSSAQAQSATAFTAARACVPTCRDGFICHNQICINACNPPCRDGAICTGGTSAQCRLDWAAVSMNQQTKRPSSTERLPFANPPEELDPDNALPFRAMTGGPPSQAWERDQQNPPNKRTASKEEGRTARKGRRARAPSSDDRSHSHSIHLRNRLRLIVGARLGLHTQSSRYVVDEGISGSQGGLSVGVRWHFNHHWGTLLTTEAMLGSWVGDRSYSSQGRMSTLRMQLAPYYRPYRHIMLGPTVAFGRNNYGSNTELFLERNTWLSGIGFQLGWLPGLGENIQATTGLMLIRERFDGPAALPVGGQSMDVYSSLAVAF